MDWISDIGLIFFKKYAILYNFLYYVLLFDVFFTDLLSSIFVFCERRLKNPKGLFISYELVETPRAPNSHYTMV